MMIKRLTFKKYNKSNLIYNCKGFTSIMILTNLMKFLLNQNIIF